jgi:hypothetical protein
VVHTGRWCHPKHYATAGLATSRTRGAGLASRRRTALKSISSWRALCATEPRPTTSELAGFAQTTAQRASHSSHSAPPYSCARGAQRSA